ncbi:ADP-ribosylation factor protein 3 [Malassezia pachydermatis]|uniref:Arl3p n=1 Tax=Malassezia pachydermatis TaxID=77020 RepID=A0A0M8MPP4_9BASI|nr:arl3p [Malassezia pachydermatis]KOS14327.1 arl3p [Malassezia pachydermatis]
MYHLVAGLYAQWNKKSTYHVLLIGLQGGGKTWFQEALRHHYLQGRAPSSRLPPTVGQNVLDLPYQKRILRFWDLGGAPSMRSLWAQYMADAHVLVWVIDGPAWIHNASVENEAAPTYRDATSLAWRAVAEEAHTRGQPIVVLVTKMDDVSSASLVDEIHASLTKTWREGHSDTTPAYALSCYGVSAKTGEGLASVLEAFLADAQSFEATRPPTA